MRTCENGNAVADGYTSSYSLRLFPSPQGEGLLNSALWVKPIFKNYLPQKQNESSVIESSASVASLVQREVARLAVTEGL